MKLSSIHAIRIAEADRLQLYRLSLMKSGTVIGFSSLDDQYYLQWWSGDRMHDTTVDFFEQDPFSAPSLFHFEHYAGLYSSEHDFIVVYDENNKEQSLKIPIINHLPKMKFPGFDKKLVHYLSAGNTDSNIIPMLFRGSGLFPVYVADLQIDMQEKKAQWLNLKYWQNQHAISLNETCFVKPGKTFALLHALNRENFSYVYGIGDRESGYLKPGMECSELAGIDSNGKVIQTLFSLGRLYKEAKKGGKECIFSSSGQYAILTPAFKSDEWKNQQKLLDITSRQLIDIELPKALSGYRIIDHHHNSFLLVDNYSNTIFARTQHMVICQAL